jgi:fumarate hydratase class II
LDESINKTVSCGGSKRALGYRKSKLSKGDSMVQNKMRIERDSMGEMEVPIDALYGASTMRAVLNFPISDLRFPRTFIRALGVVKQSAAKTNMDLGVLSKDIGEAIIVAADEVIKGDWDGEFVLDIFQTGSGTSTNTNANEVIANRASQIMGGDLGSRLVHPNDHVNLGQSSNDVIPTTIHVAGLIAIGESLIPALQNLRAKLNGKSEDFWDVMKTGRTHLQDATPIRLGQEFSGFAAQAEYSIERLERCRIALREVALGGTAVGTGVFRKDL